MTSDIEAFRAELKAAGEPWQQRGIKVCAAGFVALVAAQLSAHVVDRLALVLAAFLLALSLLAVGWAFLIIAFVRRRRWAKTRTDLTLPTLPDLP
jgi:hypothetical protein